MYVETSAMRLLDKLTKTNMLIMTLEKNGIGQIFAYFP